MTGVSSVARRNGWRPGDIVLEVNGREVHDSADIARAAARKARDWVVGIERDGKRGALRFRG